MEKQPVAQVIPEYFACCDVPTPAKTVGGPNNGGTYCESCGSDLSQRQIAIANCKHFDVESLGTDINGGSAGSYCPDCLVAFCDAVMTLGGFHTPPYPNQCEYPATHSEQGKHGRRWRICEYHRGDGVNW